MFYNVLNMGIFLNYIIKGNIKYSVKINYAVMNDFLLID